MAVKESLVQVMDTDVILGAWPSEGRRKLVMKKITIFFSLFIDVFWQNISLFSTLK